MPLISTGDVRTPANWFLPLFLPLNLYSAILMKEIKVVFLSSALEKISPGRQNKTFTIFSPVTKVCVLSAKTLMDTEGQTLCIINNQTIMTLLHYHIVQYRGGFVQIATANCVSCILAHRKSFVPKKRNQIFTFLYVFIKQIIASKLWEIVY